MLQIWGGWPDCNSNPKKTQLITNKVSEDTTHGALNGMQQQKTTSDATPVSWSKDKQTEIGYTHMCWHTSIKLAFLQAMHHLSNHM